MAAAGPAVPDVRAIDRAALLLRLMCARTQVGWRLVELARAADLGPATTHRLLAALVTAGFASRVAGSRRYCLGPSAFLVGAAAAQHFDVDRIARVPLARAARALQGTLYVKVRSGDESVCIARHDGGAPNPALMLDVGGRRPLALTAGGAAILLGLPRAEQVRIERANAAAIAGQGRATSTAVRRMLARSRRHGFGANLGDIVAGLSAIAVAVPRAGEAPIASLSVAFPVATLGDRRIASIVERLRATAASLEGSLAALRY